MSCERRGDVRHSGRCTMEERCSLRRRGRRMHDNIQECCKSPKISFTEFPAAWTWLPPRSKERQFARSYRATYLCGTSEARFNIKHTPSRRQNTQPFFVPDQPAGFKLCDRHQECTSSTPRVRHYRQQTSQAIINRFNGRRRQRGDQRSSSQWQICSSAKWTFSRCEYADSSKEEQSAESHFRYSVLFLIK